MVEKEENHPTKGLQTKKERKTSGNHKSAQTVTLQKQINTENLYNMQQSESRERLSCPSNHAHWSHGGDSRRDLTVKSLTRERKRPYIIASPNPKVPTTSTE